MDIEEVIICPECSGWGTREIPDRQGTYDIVDCEKCNKTGRLIQTTIIKTRPYGENSDIN